MKVKLKNGGSAGEERILAVEDALGYRLSDSFRDFVRTHDGAKPENNTFRITENNNAGVNRFIPVDEIMKERAHIENIPGSAYPIAWAEGGNYVFVDEGKGGAVFFWDHELPQQIVELAPSFAGFLESLEPFDIKTVELKPGQVKRVWVDPEFLKKLKKT